MKPKLIKYKNPKQLKENHVYCQYLNGVAKIIPNTELKKGEEYFELPIVAGGTHRTDTSNIVDRFWSKVDCGTEDECWEWKSWKHPNGYGKIIINNKQNYAHRIAYELEVTQIPKHHEIHHKCENTICVNPYHLQLVTQKEHMYLTPNNIFFKESQQTHCKRGHEFTAKNTGYHQNSRYCRICDLVARKRWYERKKNKA